MIPLTKKALAQRLRISETTLDLRVSEAKAHPKMARIPWPPAEINPVTRRVTWDSEAVDKWIKEQK